MTAPFLYIFYKRYPIRPSFSMERKLSVRTFWLIPSRFFFNSLNRQGRFSRFRIISNFHLLPMSETVVATGHSGNPSFVRLVIVLPVFL